MQPSVFVSRLSLLSDRLDNSFSLSLNSIHTFSPFLSFRLLLLRKVTINHFTYPQPLSCSPFPFLSSAFLSLGTGCGSFLHTLCLISIHSSDLRSVLDFPSLIILLKLSVILVGFFCQEQSNENAVQLNPVAHVSTQNSSPLITELI